MTSRPVASLLLLGALAPGRAAAEAASADIELVHPSFSLDGALAIDHPRIHQGLLGVGLLTHYASEPLVLTEEGEEQGIVIGARQDLDLGVCFDLAHNLSVRAVVPLAWQWGGELPDLAADGPGVRDPSLGGRVTFFQGEHLVSGVRGDVFLPLGTPGAWMGEGRPRGQVGLLLATGSPVLELIVDLSVTLRRRQELEESLVLGPEFNEGLAVRYGVWPDRVHLLAGLTRRDSFDHPWRTAGENGTEALVAAQVRTGEYLRWDVGMGKGIDRGYGTSEARVLLGVSVTRRLVPDVQEGAFSLDDGGLVDEEQAEPPPPATAEWGEGQLARLEVPEIKIREPIRFRVASADLLPSSRPVLAAVADVILQDPAIRLVVIEGHASEEGDFGYNYELSIRRARAIQEALIAEGVHPTRLSLRAMGEVEPAAAGTDEGALAQSRRVVFHVVDLAPAREPGGGR